jgi:hypothetical protein
MFCRQSNEVISLCKDFWKNTTRRVEIFPKTAKRLDLAQALRTRNYLCLQA